MKRDAAVHPSARPASPSPQNQNDRLSNVNESLKTPTLGPPSPKSRRSSRSVGATRSTICSEHGSRFMQTTMTAFGAERPRTWGRTKRKAPTFGSRGRSLRPLAVWGTMIHRPSMSDAPGSDCISILYEVTASTKGLIVLVAGAG